MQHEVNLLRDWLKKEGVGPEQMCLGCPDVNMCRVVQVYGRRVLVHACDVFILYMYDIFNDIARYTTYMYIYIYTYIW